MAELSRRRFLSRLGLGVGTVAVLGAGGATWRAVDQGVFAAETGPAFAAWDAWAPPGTEVLDLVRAAVLAASAHNTQPWLFRVAASRIDLFADLDRNLGTMDPLRRELHLSVGCALENLVLAAAEHSRTPAVTVLPDPADPSHLARVDLVPAKASSSPLAAAIPRRHTNRAAYDTDRAVGQPTLDALSGLIDTPGLGLVWFTTPEQKRAFGELTVRATAAIIADAEQAADSFAWYRGSWSQLQERKDGVTVDASGQPALIRTFAKLLTSSPKLNDDAWLAATRDTHVPTAAAFGTLVVTDPLDPAARLNAGRTWQRLHLWATANDLAAQPLNQVQERIDREHSARLTPEFTTALAGLLPGSGRAVFSFRIGYPTTAAARSPRRPAQEVLRA